MDKTEGTVDRVLPESADESAEQLVERALQSNDRSLLIFAREMCEFCWAAKRFFTAIAAPYRILELDAEEYQRGHLHHEIRKVLQRRTGSHTVPQIFIGQHFVGGATDSFAAWKTGEFQQRLQAADIPFNETADLNMQGNLHGWLHGP